MSGIIKTKLKAAGKKILAIKSPRLFVPASLCLIIAFLASAASGATLAEYRKKLADAAALTEDLIYIDEEGLSPKERERHEKDVVAELRKTLPATETVEMKDGRIETDNSWLQQRLDEYGKQTNQAQRKNILLDIRERLSAIKQRLNELENPAASNRSKDEDKRKLSEILKREEYQKPQEKEESFIQRILRKIREWFRREAPDAPEMSESTKSGFSAISQFLQILLYVLIFGVIGFLVYKFLPFAAERFKSREKREKKERVILGERIAENESGETLFSEAELLAREGNLRGAIRKGYIALLCELSDRKLIGLAQHKTNRDYLRDVRKRRELHENMHGLTQNYERHWYGFDEADEKDWEEFRSGYKKAISS